MDLILPGLRDRRVAAADINRTRDGRQIYRRGTPARRLSMRHSRGGFDIRQAQFNRSPAQITTIVLHQTHFFRGGSQTLTEDESRDMDMGDDFRMDHIIAHFVILREGDILYTHDVQYTLNSVSGLPGIDIEIEGEYGHRPSPQGSRLSEAAIRAGRRLVNALAHQIPTVRYIHPHGQIQQNPTKLYTCPGPDIWMNIGEWAVDASRSKLGLISDRTPGYRHNRMESLTGPTTRYLQRRYSGHRNPAYDQGVTGM